MNTRQRDTQLYSPEEFLEAAQSITPEGKSKAIFSLQQALVNLIDERDQLRKYCSNEQLNEVAAYMKKKYK